MAAVAIPVLSQARALALLTELLAGFSSKDFQKKLDLLVRKHLEAEGGIRGPASVICAAPSEIFQLEGRKELALTVQKEVLPRYGFEGSELGVAQMVRAIQPLLFDPRIKEQSEAVKKKLRMPSKHDLDSDSDSDSGDPAAKAKPVRKEKVVKLLKALILEYSQPDFKTRYCSQIHSLDPEAVAQRRLLVREVETTVLPQHGFKVTDDMKATFAIYAEDEEVQMLEQQLEEQLSLNAEATPSMASAATWARGRSCGTTPLSTSPVSAMSPVKTPNSSHSSASPVAATSADGARPCSISKQDTVALLRELLAAFSTPTFQQQVHLLKRATASHTGNAGKMDGCDELALAVQCRVLPRYGFEGSRRGVLCMICECSRHIKDPTVSMLNDAINGKLGRGAQEQQRFRQQLGHLSAMCADR